MNNAKVLLTLLVATFGLIHGAAAQTPSTIAQEGEMVIDKLGHAKYQLTTKMNARNWEQWKQLYGNAHHVLKRDLSNNFSAYHMSGFDISVDDTNRTFTVKLEFEGASVYRGDGFWEMEIEDGMRVSKLTDTQWLVQMTEADGATLLQQNLKVSLPSGASDVTQATGELGEEVLRYKLQPSGGADTLIPGALTTVAGLGLLGFGFTRREPPRVMIDARARLAADEGPEPGAAAAAAREASDERDS